MQKVMIALDYDPTAQKVAEQGYAMAKALRAGCYLIHITADPVYYASREYSPITGFTGYMDLSPFQTDTIEGIKNASHFYLENVKQHLGDPQIQILVKEGDVADSLLKTANEINADLIVMGSHSRKWLENIVMGSVTEKVFHHTSIPLLIIPTKKHS